MKTLAALWASLRKFTWIDWTWRLSLLALPWQTRWFHEGITLGGYPWEQSRWSIYAAGILLLLTIAAALVRGHRPPLFRSHGWIVGLLLISLSSIYLVATVQWWLQIVLIGFWVWALLALNPDHDKLLRWFMLGLVPSALIAISQFWLNAVWGSKWLGIASQNPLTPGVSVIMFEGQRLLRAYGTFPHPNILGGWMAVGVIAALIISIKENRHGWKELWLICGSFLLLALTFSYSRSAWLAAGLGFTIIAWRLYKAKAIQTQWQAWAYLALTFTCALVATSPHWLVRLQSSDRLEQKSITERSVSISQTWEIGKQHLWLGTGPGTSLAALAPLDPTQVPVPPHAVPLMIWLEMGLLGCFFLILGVWPFRGRLVDPLWFIILLPAFLVDHYLWSLWSGQLLFGLCLVLALSIPPFRLDKID